MTSTSAFKSAALGLAALAGLATTAAAAPESVEGAGLNVTKVVLDAGRLVIAGTAKTPRLAIAIKGTTFRTVADAKGAFAFQVDLQPADCRVALTSTAGQIGLQVANCGLKGPAGKAGPAGAAGLKGPSGPKGRTGATGPVGDAGLAGETGDKGPIGAQGPIGDKGPTGPDGPAGPKGDTGSFAGKIFDATVSRDGTLVRGSAGVVAGRTSAGLYILSFPRDVRDCTAMGAVGSEGAIDEIKLPYSIAVRPGTAVSGGLDRQLSVATFAMFDPSNSAIVIPTVIDVDFTVQVLCL